jgi:hypothetical protein
MVTNKPQASSKKTKKMERKENKELQIEANSQKNRAHVWPTSQSKHLPKAPDFDTP